MKSTVLASPTPSSVEQSGNSTLEEPLFKNNAERMQLVQQCMALYLEAYDEVSVVTQTKKKKKGGCGK